jgi:hypothetical protein
MELSGNVQILVSLVSSNQFKQLYCKYHYMSKRNPVTKKLSLCYSVMTTDQYTRSFVPETPLKILEKVCVCKTGVRKIVSGKCIPEKKIDNCYNDSQMQCCV